MPWISHLFYLDGLSQVGCCYSLNDLTPPEWEGLLLMKIVKNEIEEEMEKKEKRSRELQATADKTVRR